MHSIQRSAEPRHLARVRRSYAQWDGLSHRDRGRIRRALWRDFKGICGYCENPCERPTRAGNSPNEETIDHFRPRSRFAKLTFDWVNLVYSCKRCNDAKGDQWPQQGDQVNQILTVGYVRYKSVSGYVDPNSTRGKRSAQDFFDFDVGTGEILAADGVDDEEWSIALRTIRDVDLNDNSLGENEPRHLRNRRLRHLGILIERLRPLDDSARVWLAYDFTLPDKPFSSFINAYFRRTFPQFDRIFPV